MNAAPGKRGSNSSSMVSPRQPTKHSKPHASSNYSSVAGNIHNITAPRNKITICILRRRMQGNACHGSTLPSRISSARSFNRSKHAGLRRRFASITPDRRTDRSGPGRRLHDNMKGPHWRPMKSISRSFDSIAGGAAVYRTTLIRRLQVPTFGHLSYRERVQRKGRSQARVVA